MAERHVVKTFERWFADVAHVPLSRIADKQGWSGEEMLGRRHHLRTTFEHEGAEAAKKVLDEFAGGRRAMRSIMRRGDLAVSASTAVEDLSYLGRTV